MLNIEMDEYEEFVRMCDVAKYTLRMTEYQKVVQDVDRYEEGREQGLMVQMEHEMFGLISRKTGATGELEQRIVSKIEEVQDGEGD